MKINSFKELVSSFYLKCAYPFLHTLSLGIEMFESLKKETEKWGVFPNTRAVAYYSFFTQSVHLSSIDQQDVEKLVEFIRMPNRKISFEHYSLLKNTFGVLHHEYAHWLDNVSTIWGIDLLTNVYEAKLLRSSDLLGVDCSADYHKIKKLLDWTKRVSYNDYYTTIYEPENQAPWRFEYSIGKLFDKTGNVSKYPIIFSKFRTKDAKELICRVPFSLSSILESSAMAQELHINSSALQALSEDVRFVELEVFKSEIFSVIYDQHLCVYNAAVHHVANSLGMSDIIAAYGVCSIISRLVLNFPSCLFDKIILPKELVADFTKGQHTDIWMEDFRFAFKHHDRAVLFFLLIVVASYEKNSQEMTLQTVHSIIEQSLSLLGIGVAEIIKNAKDEIDQKYEILKNTKQPMAEYIVSTGKKIYSDLGIFGRAVYKFQDFSPIPAILGDDTLFAPYGQPKKLTFNLIDDVYEAMDIEPYVRKFEEACIF